MPRQPSALACAVFAGAAFAALATGNVVAALLCVGLVVVEIIEPLERHN